MNRSINNHVDQREDLSEPVALPRPGSGRSRWRTVTGLAVLALGLVAHTGTASAHVTPVESSAPAGGYTTVELQIPHGCEGAATEKVEVQLNDEISSVKAQAVPGWNVTYEREALEDPIELHGKEVLDYVSVVTWTAVDAPLPDDQYLRFGISMKMPDAAGTTQLFPVVQHCVGGAASSWIDADPEAEHPAPSVELVAAESGHGATTTTAVADGEGTSVTEVEGSSGATTETAETDGGSDSLARILGVVAVVLAAAALGVSMRSRKA